MQEQRRATMRKADHSQLFHQQRQLLIHHKLMSDDFYSLFSQDPKVYQLAV